MVTRNIKSALTNQIFKQEMLHTYEQKSQSRDELVRGARRMIRQLMLKGKDIRQSMSRKGNCLDNAVVENFFGLLKSELLYLQKFASIEQFKTELVSYLEYYNNRRIKLSPGGLPPAVHRCKTLGAA